MAKRVLIVGGSAGGASTAVRLRRLDENAEITILEKDNFISFANCGLPYYLGGVIKEKDKLFVQTPEVMHSRFRIDVRTNNEVVEVNTLNKSLKVKTKDGREYEKEYDYLVLAPGSNPLIPKLPGIESSKIFTMGNVSDADRIIEYVDKNKIKRALVAGGNYIGLEIAENLAQRQVGVTLVESSGHILPSFDVDMEAVIEKELSDNAVALILNDGIKAFKEEGEEIKVSLNSGETLVTQVVILAAGLKPDTSFLDGSNIMLNSKGYIAVDDHMGTSAEDVFAVGDAVETVNFVTGEKGCAATAGPALRQGRIAADNICGTASDYKGMQGTVIVKIFKMAAASTGSNERELQRCKIPYRTAVIHPMSHAAYYPGASELCLKLLFNDEGRILGAQVIGYEAVDKTLDVLAAVIRMKGTIYDLAELELCGAPPYSSAKTPVNMAGFVAENILRGSMEIFKPEEAYHFKDKAAVLVDVRMAQEYEAGHMEGAVNIPVDELRSRLGELDKDKEILVYCQVGIRGYIASRILEQNGFRVKNMIGGYKYAVSSEFNPEQYKKAADKEETNSKPDEDSNKAGPKEKGGNTKISKEVDASGLSCPGPLMSVKAAMDEVKNGEVVRAKATDPGFYEDIKSWSSKTKNELISLSKDGSSITAVIRKSGAEAAPDKEGSTGRDNKTIIVFSGDLDKAIAAFIIANGAASMGKKVTMFFTFWGINILRKSSKVKVNKGITEKMFGIMLPKGSKRLKLSQLNMIGVGPKMIRGIMKKRNVNSLEELIRSGMDSGIEMVACQMSMDLLGFKKEELIDGVKIGGVGYYLGETEDSNLNLFI